MRIVRNRSQEGSRSASTRHKNDMGSEHGAEADSMLRKNGTRSKISTQSNAFTDFLQRLRQHVRTPYAHKNSGTHSTAVKSQTIQF